MSKTNYDYLVDRIVNMIVNMVDKKTALPVKINLLRHISKKDLLACGIYMPSVSSLRRGDPCSDGAEYFRLLKSKKIQAITVIIDSCLHLLPPGKYVLSANMMTISE